MGAEAHFSVRRYNRAMQEETTSLEAFETAARRFTERLSPQNGQATVVTLSGSLGAGKTHFTKVLARTLGVTETVTSPTFVLEKVYALPVGGQFDRLVHIDAYRLHGAAELAPLNLDRELINPRTLVVIEWPEQIADAGLVVHYAVQIRGTGETRTIIYG